MTRHPTLALMACGLACATAAGIPLPDETDAGAAAGSVTIRAVQGTPGGPAIGAEAVTVQLYHQGMVLNTFETRLDERGTAELDGLPLAVPVQPVAQVQYGDMTYQKVGTVLDGDHRRQTLDVICYERTEVEPRWAVRMWHVMIDREPRGLSVVEVVVVESPADRTWIGRPGVGDRPVTTTFALHERATDVALGRGFHDWCCTTQTEGRLVNHLPLMPGTTEYKFNYVVPAGDAAELTLVAPAPVDQLMVLGPESLGLASPDKLEPMGTEAVGGRTIAAWGARGLEHGATLTLRLGAGPAPVVAATAAGDGTAGVARIIAVAGGAAILVAVVVVLLRPRRGDSGASP